MMTVNEVSKLTGVSIRTLQYYDRIGLLKPASYTEAGYRQYDETSLELLQQILLFRELEFPLKEIQKILDSPYFDKSRALDQQIRLLTLKKEHLENLIGLAEDLKEKGGKELKFDAFDTAKIDEYAARARESWGTTDAYKEYEEKSRGRSKDETLEISLQLKEIFEEFGAVKDQGPDSEKAQYLVKKLQDHICAHYYTCTDQILSGLGKMYSAGGEFTDNIDSYGGKGTAAFASAAIDHYCMKRAEKG